VGESQARKARRILVADDDATIRRLMEVFLRTLGYEAIVVADGAQALEAVERQRPDLVISDIHMPVLGGLELTQRLREHPSLASVPILLFSASISQSDETRWRDAGADGFVVKPPTLASLRETLASMLGG
jgi:two-component system phosphate regulon response regulator PhoB